MNLASLLVLALLILGVVLAGKSIRKGGGSCCGSCDGCCASCSRACEQKQDR